jgi:hypothetical protein
MVPPVAGPGWRPSLPAIIRIIMTTLGAVAGFGVVIAILVLVLLLTGDPKPCVNRTSVVTTAAAQAADAKWEAFKAAKAGAAVAFNEQEATSRGTAYADERGVPMRNLQVYFCPDGRAEARGKVSFLGRDISILIRGHLDVTDGRNRIEVDSVKAGNLPSQIGTRIADELLNRNNARDLPLEITLKSSVTTDGSHTLTR